MTDHAFCVCLVSVFVFSDLLFASKRSAGRVEECLGTIKVTQETKVSQHTKANDVVCCFQSLKYEYPRPTQRLDFHRTAHPGINFKHKLQSIEERTSIL